MCEWLNSRQWCDVRLRCSGRSFSAHRAVLASVSSFLRQILLSCSHDETPTFIVLPDFDLEAMSSVLYYIYNGEVIVQKHKLETFLEIIRSMQIHIDDAYLPEEHSDKVSEYKICRVNEWVNKRTEVFSLGTCDDKDFINIKKGSDINKALQQYSVNSVDFRDKQVRHHGPTYSDVVQPLSVDRQRGFLRDLYTETYPRSSNGNGRAAGVMAIPNERYRAPSSALLMNSKHLEVDDAPAISKISINSHIWYTDVVNQKQSVTGPYDSDDSSLKHFSQNSKFAHSRNILTHCSNSPPPLIRLPDIKIMNDVHINSNFLGDTKKKLHERELDPHNTIQDEKCRAKPVKSAILNQVLGSPWSPRLPINYRPSMHRKADKNQTKVWEPSKKNDHDITVATNDNNNNIKSTEDIDGRERISPIVEERSSDTVDYSDFKCTICNQVFTSNATLSSHMTRHSSARYNCSECGKSFSQLRNYKYHMSIHRGTREFAATCAVCGKYFNDRGYLSSHMKIHRNRKEYKCSQCPKSFNQRVAYNMHVRIHTGVKPHVCGECGKAFSRKMLLKQHQRTHSGERPYACSHCDKRFADRSNMTLHLRLHTGVKPFSCSLCPKSFTKKHHLKSHLNFHTGAKPYSCPRCKLAFTQSSNMRTHLKKCTAPEPDIRENMPTTLPTS